MDNNELIDILQKADKNKVDQFMSKNKSTLKMTESSELKKFDYSWIDKIEECIEYLDKVVRNPRKFIAQEEEIVPIEKAKKISLESIRHLAQHTNLIQDVDEKGNITPSAVLNIHKEESFDIYENRFVKSLLDNLRSFIYLRKNATASGSSSKIERKMTYDAETKIDHENIKVTVSLETKSHEELMEQSPTGLSVDERVQRIELIISDFYKSLFIRELANAIPVKSPIRKTNVILKNQNFKKLLTLWEFISSYEDKDINEAAPEHEIEDSNNVAGKMNMSFFLDYAILSSVASQKKDIKDSVNKYYLQKLISDFIDSNQEVDEKEFKKIMLDEFKHAYQARMKVEKEILRLINNDIKHYKKMQKNALKCLR